MKKLLVGAALTTAVVLYLVHVLSNPKFVEDPTVDIWH
jgi:hypothetical protein